ncbi:MAG: DNA polymerase III subunit epsilon [Alphaproteobacteria bacterium]|nr:MAG: DNA polymerase III subunit epsilon [Alphaproteobacteria bacterium]
MRTIILDTETTGLNCKTDKIIEIGCIELINFEPKNKLHLYVNPEVQIAEESTKIHGLTYDFLKHKPNFAVICDQFLEFIKDATLVAHNAKFDIGFLNQELQNIGRQQLTNAVVDTLLMARKQFPGSPANLDALAKRFNISLEERAERHGALIDAAILSKVFIALNQFKQPISLFASENNTQDTIQNFKLADLEIQVSQDELDLHRQIVSDIKKNYEK